MMETDRIMAVIVKFPGEWPEDVFLQTLTVGKNVGKMVRQTYKYKFD